MINQQTLQTLLSDNSIKTVAAECADIGLLDIQLFVTNEVEDKDKIHFLGKGEQEGINVYLIRQVERQLAQALGCEVTIRSENALNELIKEEVLSNTASYTHDNKEAIKNFFDQQILPRAQGEFFLEEEIQKEDEDEKLGEEVLEQIKQNPTLWEKVEQHPNALIAARKQLEQLYKRSQLVNS